MSVFGWCRDLFEDAAAALDRWNKGWVPSDDEAAELGFMPMDVLRANRIIASAAASPNLLIVAMDLSRFVMEPLEETTFALVLAEGGHPQRLWRWGLDAKTVRAEVAGMAKAYARTFNGQAEVRAARRALLG